MHIHIAYLDRVSCSCMPACSSPPQSDGAAPVVHTVPDSPGDACMTLLYRPGHYDVLYRA